MCGAAYLPQPAATADSPLNLSFGLGRQMGATLLLNLAGCFRISNAKSCEFRCFLLKPPLGGALASIIGIQ